MKQVIVAFDQLFNTFLGGKADETLSARAWRLQTKSKAWKFLRVVIDEIFLFEDNHCYESYLSELNRKQLPAEYSK